MPRQKEAMPQEKINLFRDSLYYEIIHTFGVPRGLTNEQLDNHAIGETINFSRQVHGRLLSQFLYRRAADKEARNGDAFAEDFGFDPTSLFSNDEDRELQAKHAFMNKQILHLTYDRVSGNLKKPWSTEWLNQLMNVTINFMSHILSNDKLESGEPLFASTQAREAWQTLLDCLKICLAGKRLRFESGFECSSTWYKPECEEGRISTLYGTVVKQTPTGAARVSSATNTTSTSWTCPSHG